MAHRTITDEELLDRAFELLRMYGTEGVSLSRLSKAVDLEKASLYHRYPRGKDEIVLAVVARVSRWFDEHVFTALKTGGSPRKRVGMVTEKLRHFYGDGSKSCVTDVLSLAGGGDELETALRIALVAWMKAFAGIAKESGLSPAMARLRAEEAIVRIEGSLIVGRVLGDKQPFQRVMKLLPQLLTEA